MKQECCKQCLDIHHLVRQCLNASCECHIKECKPEKEEPKCEHIGKTRVQKMETGQIRSSFTCIKCGETRIDFTTSPEPQMDWGKSTDEFMRNVGIVRKWFSDEELEVSDFVLGRMASRLKDLRSESLEEFKKELRVAVNKADGIYHDDGYGNNEEYVRKLFILDLLN